LGEVTLSVALASSRAILLCLAASQALRGLGVFGYAKTPWRQAQVCLRPLPSYGEDRASRPPPLQHRVLIRITSNSISRDLRRRRPYPDCSGAFSVTGWAAFGTDASARTWCGSSSASRLPGHTYEPLYVIYLRRHSAAAILRSVRNPCVIQADSEPPGRRPPAPGSHIRRCLPSPGELSLAQAWWEFPRLSPIPVPSLSSSRNPKL
jgi:hypothetical protein